MLSRLMPNFDMRRETRDVKMMRVNFLRLLSFCITFFLLFLAKKSPSEAYGNRRADGANLHFVRLWLIAYG